MRKTLKERFDEKWVEDPDTSCWNWMGSKHNAAMGYGRISTKGIWKLAHRVSYELHKGEISEGFLVCHTCDNPLCVNPDHLFLGTHDDNMKDMVDKKRSPLGYRNNSNKLTEEQVMNIFNDNGSMTKIAEKYNIHRITVNNIKLGKIWSWLTGKKYIKPKRSKGNSKLTEEQVVEIFYDNRKLSEIEKEYNINRHIIWRIKTKKAWKHVTDKL